MSQAALEAVAVARGMPRWRQYASLNTDEWKSWPRYRTRFDGILDEDSLFALAISLVLAGVVQFVRYMLLRRENRVHTAVAVHDEIAKHPHSH